MVCASVLSFLFLFWMCINNEKELNLVYIECAEMTSFVVVVFWLWICKNNWICLTLNVQKREETVLNVQKRLNLTLNVQKREDAVLNVQKWLNLFDTECAETRGSSAACSDDGNLFWQELHPLWPRSDIQSSPRPVWLQPAHCGIQGTVPRPTSTQTQRIGHWQNTMTAISCVIVLL